MKINITRIFETSRALATAPGQLLADFITYCSEAFSQVIVALRNRLTFEDNFQCLIKDVDFSDGISTVINTDGKMPSHIIISRTFNYSNYINMWTWQLDNNNQLEMKIKFDPTPTSAIKVRLLIFY